MNATSQDPFPVKLFGHKPSYSSSPVVWIRQASLQTDVQKVLRHARKMPEKTQHFYKELNRIKKAALSIGFYELLDGVASIFDRECAMLPGTGKFHALKKATFHNNLHTYWLFFEYFTFMFKTNIALNPKFKFFTFEKVQFHMYVWVIA